MKTACWRVAAVAAMLLLVGTFSASQANNYVTAKGKYDKYIKKPSLLMRTRGRLILADSRDMRALKILKESYPKPEAPKEQVRSLLVSISANHFTEANAVPLYQEWRKAHTLPQDAWLWYRSLCATQSHTGDAELEAAILDTKKSIFIRAAAMEALAECSSTRALSVMMALVPEAREARKIERIVMLESMARMLFSAAHERTTDDFRKAALEFIPLMDAKETEDRTRLVMGRYFKETFGGDHLWINADPWLEKLLNPEKPQDPADSRYREPPPPTEFMGVKGAGLRIVYVIDLSDSMMTPLSVKEIEDIKKPPPPPPGKGPVTGKGEGQGEKEGEKKEEEPAPPKRIEDSLPWDKIKNRFHAAREYLKASLRTLRKEQQFCVIVFGTEAKTLKNTKGLVQASPAAIEAVIRELDAIKPGGRIPDRPHGTLMGYTNLHGGIHRAFKAKPGGLLPEGEYVDASSFTQGADTVFILSDGDPSWDDWMQEDEWDPMDRAGDPESGTPGEKQPIVRAVGPYGYMYDAVYLPDDVMRLNLFRKCEIYCIGIGEASSHRLQAIAAAALGGEVRPLGSK